jgi:Rrf2 family protein
MRISQRAQYAVQALLDLAVHEPSPRGIRSAEIARRTRAPEKFLEAILRDLREAGLVSSKRGPDGGHRLAVVPSQVTVMAVVEAIDGPFKAVVADPSSLAGPEDSCLRVLWGQVDVAVRATLGAVTIDELRREAVAPGPVDYNI